MPLTCRGKDSPKRSSPVCKEESRSSRRLRSPEKFDKDEAHAESRSRRSSKGEADSDAELRDRPSETDSGKPGKSWVPPLRPEMIPALA